MSVFRTATTQAIRDIIADHGKANRFGMSLTDEDIETICGRVVDLFEMTLNLRAQLGTSASALGSEQRAPAQNASGTAPKSAAPAKPLRWEDASPSLPSTKAASEIYDFSHLEQNSRADALPRLAPKGQQTSDFVLPKKRVQLTDDERELFMRRSQQGAPARLPAP